MREDLTAIVLVLDRSGSMANIEADMIGGVNHFLDEQRKQPGEAWVWIYLFDDWNKIERIETARPVREVPALTSEVYFARGSTALFDAQGQAADDVGQYLAKLHESQRPKKVIFMTVTDGYENSSRLYNAARIRAMIKEQRERYGWEFVYLGTSEGEVEQAVNTMGYDAAGAGKNVKRFVKNSVGTRNLWAGSAMAMNHYRGGQSLSTSADFYGSAGVDPLVAPEPVADTEPPPPEEKP